MGSVANCELLYWTVKQQGTKTNMTAFSDWHDVIMTPPNNTSSQWFHPNAHFRHLDTFLPYFSNSMTLAT